MLPDIKEQVEQLLETIKKNNYVLKYRYSYVFVEASAKILPRSQKELSR